MKYKRLGTTGLYVSELSLGSWITFGPEQVSQEEHAFDIMKAAYEGGVNFFDNAELYSAGEAERLMGRAVQMGLERKVWTRSDLVLSTKLFFGALVAEDHPDYIKYRKDMNRTGLSRKKIIEGMRNSLKRMNLDYVDLVFCHRFDPACNVEEVVRAFNFLIDQGLCFYWGTSEWTAQEIQEAKTVAERLGMIGPQMEQPQYHMFEREKVDQQYNRLYPDLGLTIWSPLAGGILTGKYKDGVKEGSRYSLPTFKESREGKTFQQRVDTTEKLRPIAEKVGCSLAQLALAWTMANPHVSTCITGATSVEQIVENVKSVEFIEKLTPEVLEEIEQVIGTKPKLPFQENLATNFRVKHLGHPL